MFLHKLLLNLLRMIGLEKRAIKTASYWIKYSDSIDRCITGVDFLEKKQYISLSDGSIVHGRVTPC